ncbi:MAG: SIMPL domain-containing protein [Gemmatimonadetes bacterium]|jgi:uncharacterized protein|nr:SIMPL domain-containing protein [Gemmatimonadota bacterium]MBT6144737.1 SIMPL domain-containing protein [Gemmatimonadota bacterium]MBT7861694.1 SIMPL domain-containing protein [Gemmatimonadota bacterium]
MKNLIALLLSLVCVTAAGADNDALEGRHLRVQGQGVIQVRPDLATLQLGVEKRSPTVTQAMAQNNEAVASILQVLASAGIDEGDVLTTELNVHRTVDRSPRRGSEEQMEKEVFVVRNLVQARIRELDHLGNIIDAAINAGANEMRGLKFGLSDDREARDSAREAAVADARHRAEQLAQLLGVRLGRVLRISEQNSGGGRPEGMMMRMADAGSAPISVGDLNFRAGVEVVFALKD